MVEHVLAEIKNQIELISMKLTHGWIKIHNEIYKSIN